MSFTFDAIGDGNCFYYSIAVRLAVDYLNNTLPDDINTGEQLTGMFREIDKFTSELKIGEKLDSDIPATTNDIFQNILDYCEIEEGRFDWVKYQLIMGRAAREYITGQIENNPVIKQYVINYLTQHLIGTLDMSTVDDMVYSDFFLGMPEIQFKLRQSVMDVGKDLDLRKDELQDWFADEGFNIWLRGQNGISLDKVYAGEIELKAFVHLFRIESQFKMPGDTLGVNQLVSGLGETIPIRMGSAQSEVYTSATTYSLEFTGAHWKVYLPEDETGINKKIHADYTPLRAAYLYGRYVDKTMSARGIQKERKDSADIGSVGKEGGLVASDGLVLPPPPDPLTPEEQAELAKISISQFADLPPPPSGKASTSVLAGSELELQSARSRVERLAKGVVTVKQEMAEAQGMAAMGVPIPDILSKRFEQAQVELKAAQADLFDAERKFSTQPHQGERGLPPSVQNKDSLAPPVDNMPPPVQNQELLPAKNENMPLSVENKNNLPPKVDNKPPPVQKSGGLTSPPQVGPPKSHADVYAALQEAHKELAEAKQQMASAEGMAAMGVPIPVQVVIELERSQAKVDACQHEVSNVTGENRRIKPK
tara:strand:- start:21705 stop:23486 length:1782 start_codon:yes stop_codon:yes gene_type:complete